MRNVARNSGPAIQLDVLLQSTASTIRCAPGPGSAGEEVNLGTTSGVKGNPPAAVLTAVISSERLS